METEPKCPVKRDGGFTLVEMLIVLTILGVVMTTLAAVFSVIVRTTPSTEARTDDARSLQGLVTWLPQDIDAAPANGGFDADPSSVFPCGGTAPVEFRNVITMTWNETSSSTTTFVAAYLYERASSGDSWTMVRYTCSDSGSGASVAERNNLTSSLPAWDDSDPPVTVVGCSLNVSGTADCPPANRITGALWNTEPVRSLKLKLTMQDGSEYTVDAAPKNPDESLADDPDAVGNAKPDVSNQVVNVTMNPNTTATFDIEALFGVSDPEGDPWTVAVDTSVPQPPGLTASVDTAFPHELVVTTAPGLPPGPLAPVTMIVSDNHYKWEDIELVVTINPFSNTPPSLVANPISVNMLAGETRIVNVLAATGATDFDGDPLGVSVVWALPGFSATTTATPGQIQIAADGLVPAGPYPLWIGLAVDDGTASVPVGLTIDIGVPNTPLTATTTTHSVTELAGTSTPVDVVTAFGIVNSDGDPLAVTATTSAPDVTATVALGVVTIDIAGGSTAGPKGSVNVTVDDGRGSILALTIDVTVVTSPPVASDCALGTLTATPASPDRVGGSSPGARQLKDTVTVTLTYTGTCNGLLLFYDSGDSTGLGTTGRVFPAGSTTSITILGNGVGGVEKFTPGPITLTASTTSSTVGPNFTTFVLNVS